MFCDTEQIVFPVIPHDSFRVNWMLGCKAGWEWARCKPGQQELTQSLLEALVCMTPSFNTIATTVAEEAHTHAAIIKLSPDRIWVNANAPQVTYCI